MGRPWLLSTWVQIPALAYGIGNGAIATDQRDVVILPWSKVVTWVGVQSFLWPT
jgi:hypothetical protein